MIKWLHIVCFCLVAMDTVAQGPPIITDTPIMLGLAGGAVRTFGRFTSTEQANTYVHVIAVPYNIGPKTQFGGILPVVFKSPAQGDSRSGIGDVTIFAKQQILQIDGDAKTFRILGKIAHTLATGDVDENPALGAGSSQTSLGLVAGRVSTTFGLYTEAGYVLGGSGLPDRFYYSFAASFPLLPQQYPPKQVNLSVDISGVQFKSGSHAMSIAPGIQWVAGRRMLFEAGFPIPINEQVPEMQQTNFSFLLGTRVLIF